MRASKIRVIAVATIALFACAAILAPGVADAKKRKKKHATLTIVVSGGDFAGRLTDKNAECVAEREVTVFEQLGATRSPASDREVGSDTTGDDGKWNTGNTGAENGSYYAHAPATPGCTALTSKTAKVTGRPPQDDGD